MPTIHYCESGVPSITVAGDRVRSNAARPRHMSDICASWKDADLKRARALLRKDTTIHCEDATACAAVSALAYDMLIHNRKVKAKIKKTYDLASEHPRSGPPV